MAIIPPKELNVGAVVPHSLDNQFISDALLRQMIKAGQDFSTPSIKERRSRLSRAEFMRSLLYAKEVVVNRAYFVNTPYLFELYSSEGGARDFAELMKTGAILPFVTGKDLLGRQDFDQHPEGAKALKRLVPLIHHIRSVSLDTEELDAKKRSDPLVILGLHATDLFASLDGIDANGCRLLLRELGAPAGLLFGTTQGLINEFQRKMQELAEMAEQAHDKNGRRILYRNDIYKRFFCIRDVNNENSVVNGRFVPGLLQSPAFIRLKKLVDTVYNFNLSDHLGCFSMTASGMGGRTIVDLISKMGGVASATESSTRAFGTEEEKLLEKARQINIQYLKKSVDIHLPDLEKLTIRNVHDIRQDKKWKGFIQSKRNLMEISSADDLPEAFTEFVHRHKELHLEMTANSSWKIPMKRLIHIMHLVETPYLKLISPAVGALGAPQPVTEAIEIGLEIPATLAFTIHSVNKKTPELRSAMSFWSTWKFRSSAQKDLIRIKKELGALGAGDRQQDNGQVEQSKS